MKMIKNDWRSRLKDSNVTNLMHVLLNSESVDSFDPTTAVHLWNRSSTRVRRITKRQSGQKIRRFATKDVEHGTAEDEQQSTSDSSEEEYFSDSSDNDAEDEAFAEFCNVDLRENDY